VLLGPYGCGKTQYLKAFCKERGLRPLGINHREGLNLLKDFGEHTALITLLYFTETETETEFGNDYTLESDENQLIALYPRGI
jgi:hypothetical protein